MLNKKKILKTIIIAFFITFTFTSCGNNSNNLDNIKEKEEIIQVFDLESLYGKNIDELKSILGTPINDTEPKDLQTNILSEDDLATEWDKTWKKDGYELSVYYNVKNREVIDFFIATNDSSGATKNINQLEKIINSENLINYTIEPVKAIKDKSLYTGIKIIPKNK